MDYDLISDDEYNALPEEEGPFFVKFDAACRRNMARILDDESTRGLEKHIREQYMAAVYATAQACGIYDIQLDRYNDSTFQDVYARFSLTVAGQVAKIRAETRLNRHPHSVQLQINTKTTIRHYIERIRVAIDTSEFDSGRKNRIYSKLDLLVIEVDNRRTSFAVAMGALAAVTAGLAVISNATTVLAEGHNAIVQIAKLIGQDKDSEEVAIQRLAPPPKALTAPSTKKETTSKIDNTSKWDAGGDLDDEIPF